MAEHYLPGQKKARNGLFIKKIFELDKLTGGSLRALQPTREERRLMEHKKKHEEKPHGRNRPS
jgi:hypothetical protein